MQIGQIGVGLECQFLSHNDGCRSRHPKVLALAWLAKLLGVVIHIEGLPYGSARNRPKRVVARSNQGFIIGDSGTVL